MNTQASVEVRAFRRRHEEVRLARRVGGQRVRFPFGTYAMRTVYGAPVADAPGADAIITQPGPLLSDVRARLRRTHAATPPSRKRVGLLDSLREHLAHDATSFDDSDCTDFASARAEVTEVAGEVRTRHRFARGTQDAAEQAGPQAARRLIVRRDRRMGRPARKAPRHSADPPV